MRPNAMRVIAQHLEGEFCVAVNELGPDDTIWTLKIKIFEATQVFPSKQLLFLKDKDPNAPPVTLASIKDGADQSKLGALTQNETTLKEYKIGNGSTVLIVPQSISQVLVPDAPAVSPPPNSRKFLALLTGKRVISPKLCFAIGRGLKRGIVCCPCSFNIYKVDVQGRQVKNEKNDDTDFEIEITKVSTPHKKTPFKIDKSGMQSMVSFTPQESGHYRITIKIDGQDISGSPFRSIVIDETSPKMQEIVYSPDWLSEVTQFYQTFSQRAEAVDIIFTVGIGGLLNLMSTAPKPVQADMTIVYSRLLKKDENKLRIIKDGGVESLKKLLKTEHWVNHIEIKYFVVQFLQILVLSQGASDKFLEDFGTAPLITIGKTPNVECARGVAKILSVLAENAVNRTRIAKDNLLPVLYILMQFDDTITSLDAHSAVSKLAELDDVQASIIKETPVLNFIMNKVASENIPLRARCLKILACISSKVEFADKLYTMGVMDVIVKLGEFLSAGIFYQWEIASCRILAGGDTFLDNVKLQFMENTNCACAAATLIANLLNVKRSELYLATVRGTGLQLLRRMARSYDLATQLEACRALTLLSYPEQENEIKESLISGGVITALVSAVAMDSAQLLYYIITTLFNLSSFNPSCLLALSASEVDKLIEVMHKGGMSLVIPSATILARIVQQDKHRARIVQGGGKLFLGHLIDLERRGEVDLLPVIDQQDLQIVGEIGRGVSGIVMKGIWQGMAVAVKTFNEMNLSFNVNEFVSETAIMCVLRHPNIVHGLGGSRASGKMYLVTELLARGSLYDIIHDQKRKLTLKRILSIAIDAALGFQYLHSLGLIHRDVKSGNLLLDNEYKAKVSDFGVSRVVAKRMTKAVGTPTYMAPEVISGLAYTEQADVYSYAFILWEMLANEVPYKDLSQISIAEQVVGGYRPEIPSKWPAPISELIKRCWSGTPTQRPSFDDIVAYLKKAREHLEGLGLLDEEDEEWEDTSKTAINIQAEEKKPEKPQEKKPVSEKSTDKLPALLDKKSADKSADKGQEKKDTKPIVKGASVGSGIGAGVGAVGASVGAGMGGGVGMGVSTPPLTAQDKKAIDTKQPPQDTKKVDTKPQPPPLPPQDTKKPFDTKPPQDTKKPDTKPTPPPLPPQDTKKDTKPGDKVVPPPPPPQDNKKSAERKLPTSPNVKKGGSDTKINVTVAELHKASGEKPGSEKLQSIPEKKPAEKFSLDKPVSPNIASSTTKDKDIVQRV